MDLTKKKCVPCEAGVAPLTPLEIVEYLKSAQGWEVHEDTEIFKKFTFKNFMEALAFVNKVGEVAEGEGHHPNIFLYDYKYVKLTLFTHAIGGLSENDFILAAKIDAL